MYVTIRESIHSKYGRNLHSSAIRDNWQIFQDTESLHDCKNRLQFSDYLVSTFRVVSCNFIHLN